MSSVSLSLFALLCFPREHVCSANVPAQRLAAATFSRDARKSAATLGRKQAPGDNGGAQWFGATVKPFATSETHESVADESRSSGVSGCGVKKATAAEGGCTAFFVKAPARIDHSRDTTVTNSCGWPFVLLRHEEEAGAKRQESRKTRGKGGTQCQNARSSS